MVSNYSNNNTDAKDEGKVTFDPALRSFMLKVYNYMASGLLLTALTSFYVGNMVRDQILMYGRPPMYISVIGVGSLIIAFAFTLLFKKMSSNVALLLFYVFAILVGVSFSSLVVVYTGATLFKTFLITTCLFGGMSLVGYTTKKDLTSMGHFLIMALFGLIIATVVNMFLHSTGLEMIISYVGVVIFVGLTAYDTQKIKHSFYLARDVEGRKKVAIMGAFELYLDFINLFIMLLRIFGGASRN